MIFFLVGKSVLPLCYEGQDMLYATRIRTQFAVKEFLVQALTEPGRAVDKNNVDWLANG